MITTGLACLILLMAGLAACGSNGGNAVSTSAAAAFESPYCVTARKWAVHELNGGGDGAYARGGPSALRKWWTEQLTYLKTSVRQAPPAIHHSEAVNERAIRTQLTPLLEKYGFDYARVEKEASSSELAFADHPPADVQKAQEARDLYQNRVCGYGGSPPPAQVTFTKSDASKAYCDAAAAQEQGLGTVASAGFAPKAFRAFATSPEFTKALEDQEAAAPPEIADDVRADNAWVRDHKLTLLEKYDYDLRRLMLEASAEELAAFTYWDPAIRTQDSRIEAYVSQICGRS